MSLILNKTLNICKNAAQVLYSKHCALIPYTLVLVSVSDYEIKEGGGGGDDFVVVGIYVTIWIYNFFLNKKLFVLIIFFSLF